MLIDYHKKVFKKCPKCGQMKMYLMRPPTGEQVSVDDLPKPTSYRCGHCGHEEPIGGLER